MWFSKWLLLFNAFSSVCSLKVLFTFPHRGKSHFLAFAPLVKALARKGHEVTLLGHFPLSTPNVTFINIDKTKSKLENVISLNTFKGHRSEKWFFVPQIVGPYQQHICEKDFGLFTVENLLDSNKEFDVMLSQHPASDCFFSLTHKFRTPLILFTTALLLDDIGQYSGTAVNPSYVSNPFLDYSPNMSFLRRLENFMVLMLEKFHTDYVWANRGINFAKKYFGENVPHFGTFGLNMSVMLENTCSFIVRIPFTPSVTEVAGIHIEEVKKLPDKSAKT